MTGYQKGEPCNRDGCNGVIDEHEKDGCCSCHINPPCGYCTTQTEFCPECGWSAEEEQNEYLAEVYKKNEAYYIEQQKRFDEYLNLFYNKYRGLEPVTELEIRKESHTHFSMRVIGVFPSGSETKESLLSKIKGTFGGRFTKFNDYSFEYIAYTD